MGGLLLYHGSDKIIETPRFGFGNMNNDYGSGFYCTKNLELAKEWACRNGGCCFVNSYSFEIEGLKVLDLTSEKYSALHWITILIENRRFAIVNPIMQASVEYLKSNYHLNISKYDVVIGYRADDSYFSYARDFITNALSVETLSNALGLGNLGIQYFIRSRKAFDNLRFISSEEVDFDEYHTKSISREKTAREEFEELRRIESFNGTFISNILTNGDNQ